MLRTGNRCGAALTTPERKHGHAIECPGTASKRERSHTVTVRVLVVDDEPDVAVLLRQLFRREMHHGLYTLDFARSAAAALAELDGTIGADINMPGMSGLDLLPVVKRRRPELPVFMVSAHEDASTIAAVMADPRGIG
jgi:DNA-binding NtrC family response regulator